MGLATITSGSGAAVREAAAAAVAPDPLTAQILAKHSAGQPLTPKESGKLGAFRARLKRLVSGPDSPAAKSPGAGAAPGGAPGLAAVAPDQASPDTLPPVPADPRVVQRTTEALIKTCDGIARRYVTGEARKAGADDKTANRFDSAAACPAPARDMMVETSPDVAAALGISPETFPICTFIGGLGLWATNLWLAVDELRRMTAEREKRERPAQPQPSPAPATDGPVQVNPAATTLAPATFPIPAEPIGAPPKLT